MRRSQTAFSSGELGEELYARVDVEQFGKALKTAFNVVLFPQGGLAARAGTEHICTVPNNAVAHRLLPFEFNTVQTYITLWGDQDVSIIKDGAPVLEASKAIVAISQANPGSLQVNAHGWGVGKLVYVSGATGMTALNARYFTVNSVPDANHVTLKDLYGTVINTAAMPAYTGAGLIAAVHRVATPFTSNADPDNAAAQVFFMDFAQSNDEGFTAHLDIAPQVLTRSAHNAWTLGAISYGASLAAPGGVAAAATVGAGAITYKYVVTAINDLTGEESLASAQVTCTNDLSANATYKNTVTWSAVANATRYSVYKDEAGVSGFIGGTTGLSFIDGPGGSAGGEITPDLSITPPLNYNPFPGANDYPAAVEFHEQRLCYGQTRNNPGAGWLSQPQRYKNFNRSVPQRSDDTVIFRLAPGVNAIQGFASMGDNLFCATANAEFTLAGSGVTGYITPASIAPRRWSGKGADRLKPIVVGRYILFMQAQGHKVFAFGPPVGGGQGLASIDLALLAPHIFKDHFIRDWAYQQDPHSVVWMVRDDGMLIAFTVIDELQMFAFSRVQLAPSDAGAALAESVAVISGPEEDELYIAVKRTINGGVRRHVERMKSLSWGTDLANWWGLDDALLYQGVATNTFDNLWHLEGQTHVAALVNGFLIENLTVTGGRVTLSNVDFPGGVTKALFGLLPPKARIEPLPLAQPDVTGPPQGRRKAASGVTLKLVRTPAFKAGSTDTTLFPAKLRKAAVALGTATPPYSGDYFAKFDAKYGKDGTFIVEQSPGLPLHITAMFPDIEQTDAKVKMVDA